MVVLMTVVAQPQTQWRQRSLLQHPHQMISHSQPYLLKLSYIICTTMVSEDHVLKYVHCTLSEYMVRLKCKSHIPTVIIITCHNHTHSSLHTLTHTHSVTCPLHTHSPLLLMHTHSPSLLPSHTHTLSITCPLLLVRAHTLRSSHLVWLWLVHSLVCNCHGHCLVENKTSLLSVE